MVKSVAARLFAQLLEEADHFSAVGLKNKLRRLSTVGAILAKHKSIQRVHERSAEMPRVSLVFASIDTGGSAPYSLYLLAENVTAGGGKPAIGVGTHQAASVLPANSSPSTTAI